MIIGTGWIELHLPGVRSLKEKRSILKGVIARLHKEFNLSCGEVDHHDVWQSAGLGLAVVSTSSAQAERVLMAALRWVEENRPDLEVVDHEIEIIY